MSWWEDIFNDVGDAFGNFGSFISEGLQAAFGSGGGGQSSESQYGYSGKAASDTPTPSAPSGDDSGSGGIIGKVVDFANKNKGLSEIVLKGIAGGISAENQAEQRMRELRAKDQMDQEAAARVSASVNGLRGPGIINRQAGLKRNDGSSIYTNGKIYKG